MPLPFFGSLGPTMIEARALKAALYNSEENGTIGKWEVKFVGLLQTMKAL